MDHLKKRYLRDFLSIMKVFILNYLNASPGLGEDENDISFHGSDDFLAWAKVMGHSEHYYPGFDVALLHTWSV